MKSVGRIAKKKAGYKQTRLGRIPVDWEYEEIGNRIDLLSGFAFESEGYAIEGIRLLRGSNIKRGNTDWSPFITQFWDADVDGLDKYKLKDGDLVIAMDGSLVGRSFALLTKEDLPALLLQRVARIRSSKIDIGFLKEYIGSNYFVSYCDSVKTVTAIPHISSTDIKKFKIAIPPLPEQQKIARILSTWDKAIEKTEQLIAQKQQLKKGLMQQLLTGKVRFKEFVKSKKMKKTKLGLIPEDWEVRILNDLCMTFQSGFGITSESIDEEGKYAVYGGNGLRGYTDSFTHDGEFVLIGRQGALCGNIVKIEGKNYVSEHAIAVQTNQLNDNQFLAYKLEFLDLNRFSESSAQPGLSVNKLLKLKISTPGLNEQKKIASSLSLMDRSIIIYSHHLTELKVQKKGLMQQLLTGQIRVKVN